LLNNAPAVEQDIACDRCKFNGSSKCHHDLPEFQSEEAYDCVYFQAA
jgi:hypothetical protein